MAIFLIRDSAGEPFNLLVVCYRSSFAAEILFILVSYMHQTRYGVREKSLRS
ncbi:transmembrane protein, putative [Medicago truncatula]|uniref:Transmembrane protein, putative n=1 Tax=Medicago truncatula TaxID=3880 RepID=G7JEP9_MEDTR|nr:transmembrane protein, putative [Medicago truncatula]